MSSFNLTSPITEHDLGEMQQRIGVVFRNRKLLAQAFTHRSFLNEVRIPGLKHNERLEFLGDAVLEFAVSQHLFRAYSSMEEGILTQVRGVLVSSATLGCIMQELQLDQYIQTSKGQRRESSTDREWVSISANAFEALIAAIYLDRGTGTAELFIAEHVLTRIPVIVKEQRYLDPKSRLQELAQERQRITPHYVVLSEEGPPHRRHFTCAVVLGSETIGEGRGTSKPEAEAEAARAALQKLFGVTLKGAVA